MAEKYTPLGLRMNPAQIKKLDRLCAVNQRSRREILEALINKAYASYSKDKKERINP
jgi:hypothetical protein